MLVGTPADASGRPDAATVTLAREEIEEALASDEPLDLILTVDPGTSSPEDVRVSWQRSDLEKVLAETPVGGITFSFDRAELYRALEHPDFESHGIREMVLITVAAASASAALAASTASAQLQDPSGGGGATTAVVAPGHGEATTARDLTAGGVDPAIAAAIAARDEASTAGTLATPAIHDEATPAARGVGQTVPGADEAGLAARGLDPAIQTAIQAHGEAATASDLAALAGIHDETTLAARGVDQIVPGADEATLSARGIHTPAVHDEGTLVTRGIESPAVPVDSGTGFEMPTLDSGTAAAIGGLAGAGLLIVGAAFVARRRTTPA
jgi:hypothetical protein